MNYRQPDYVRLKPPPNTKSYLTSGKLVAMKHFTLHDSLAYLSPTVEEFAAMRIAASIICAFNTTRGKKSPMLSPCDVIDYALRGSAVEEEPAWADRAQAYKTISMLRVVYRMKKMIDTRDKRDDVYITMKCDNCKKKTISITLGHLILWDGKECVFNNSELSMSRMSVDCTCKHIEPDDLYMIEEKAIKLANE